MREDFLLPSPAARQLYDTIKDYPIYDYHCHLSPREILEDRPFGNIGELWLAGDHYKWRLMRAAGVQNSSSRGRRAGGINFSPMPRLSSWRRATRSTTGHRWN